MRNSIHAMLALVFLFAANPVAATTHTLTWRVAEWGKSDPIPGATVSIYFRENQTTPTAIVQTDSSGICTDRGHGLHLFGDMGNS